MFTNMSLQTMLHTQRVGMLDIYLSTKFDVPWSSGQLVIAIKPKSKYRIHVTCI
jgi:hypothetical protein